MRQLLFLALLIVSNVTIAAVYHCTGFNGEPLYSDSPCSADGSGSAFSALSVSGPGRQVQFRSGAARPPRLASPRRPQSRKTAKTEQRCEEIARQLQTIQRRLRAGYRVQEGERLKRRRRGLEEEQFRKCR